jgi:hypothetical protein
MGDGGLSWWTAPHVKATTNASTRNIDSMHQPISREYFSGNLRSSKRSWVFCRFVVVSVQGAFAATVVVVVVVKPSEKKPGKSVTKTAGDKKSRGTVQEVVKQRKAKTHATMNVLRTMFHTKRRGQSIRKGGGPTAGPTTAANAETASAKAEQCPVAPTNRKDSAPAVVVVAAAPKTTATTTTSAPAPKRLMTSREIVDEAMRSVNEHHLVVPSIFAENAEFCFPEASMTASGYTAEMTKLYRSFPDWRLALVGDIIEHEDDGSISITVVASGTHTGAPYSFGPYPEVVATGIAVQLDPE